MSLLGARHSSGAIFFGNLMHDARLESRAPSDGATRCA
jgi:hypothetical protein